MHGIMSIMYVHWGIKHSYGIPEGNVRTLRAWIWYAMMHVEGQGVGNLM